MTGRFGAPANRALSDWMDERGMPQSFAGRRLVDLQPVHARIRPPGPCGKTRSGLFSAREPNGTSRRRATAAASTPRLIAEPADVLADPHLAARDFWSSSARPRPGAAAFVSVSVQACIKASAAPASIAATRRTALRGPDLWPACAFSIFPGLWSVRLPPRRWAIWAPTSSRSKAARGLPDAAGRSSQRFQPGNFDDKPWFAHLNTSKRSLALDMKRPESREVLDPLIRWADVVVENFSPGTMHKLGLDYAIARPRRILR